MQYVLNIRFKSQGKKKKIAWDHLSQLSYLVRLLFTYPCQLKPNIVFRSMFNYFGTGRINKPSVQSSSSRTALFRNRLIFS